MEISANLPIDDDLKSAVNEASAKGLRLVKVVMSGKPPRLVVGETAAASVSFADDFEAMRASGSMLEAAVPCIILLRLADEKGTVPGATEGDWLLLSWSPEDSPVRQKMLYTSSCKTLKDCFEDQRFKEMKATDKEEVSLTELQAKARVLHRGMTRDERHSVMTNLEIQQEQVREDQAKEQATAPKKLAGLVALQIAPQPSFDEAIVSLLAEEDKAVVAKLTGPKREELSGELLDDVGGISKLKGRLPAEEPCYVVLSLAEKRLLLLTWLPEGIAPRQKMTVSTFKKSVEQILEAKVPGCKIQKAEVSDESDLQDELANPPAEEPDAGADEAASAAAAPKKAFKPPVGGFALPGLGPPK